MIDRTNSHLRRKQPSSAGFTLLELLVIMALLTAIFLVVVVPVMQLNGEIARTQARTSEMQQNLRVGFQDMTRYARMAGRGRLPATTPAQQLPNGFAMAVRNNAVGNVLGTAIPVMPNTDVLTVRGVLFSSVYQLTPGMSDIPGGRLRVDRNPPMGGEQPLEPLVEAIDRASGGDPESLILISSYGNAIYGLPHMVGGSVTETRLVSSQNYDTSVQINVAFGGPMPAQLGTASSVGILEEYRYFVHAAPSFPGAPAGLTVPRLARLRFIPNTNTVHSTYMAGGVPVPEAIADNIIDLQLALGIDSLTPGGGGPDDRINEDLTNEAIDEWLFNDVADNPAGPKWNAVGSSLKFLRVTMIARASRLERKYSNPRFGPALNRAIEDNIYAGVHPAIPGQAQDVARHYRTRVLQTVVDLRNL